MWFVLAIISVELQLSSACSSNLSSLSVGTKSGYKLFPLSSIERLEPSFEKGKDKTPQPSWFHHHTLYCSGTALMFY